MLKTEEPGPYCNPNMTGTQPFLILNVTYTTNKKVELILLGYWQTVGEQKRDGSHHSSARSKSIVCHAKAMRIKNQ